MFKTHHLPQSPVRGTADWNLLSYNAIQSDNGLNPLADLNETNTISKTHLQGKHTAGHRSWTLLSSGNRNALSEQESILFSSMGFHPLVSHKGSVATEVVVPSIRSVSTRIGTTPSSTIQPPGPFRPILRIDPGAN